MAKSELETIKATLDKAVATTREKAATLAQRHEALIKEREAVRFAPEPLDECIANAQRLVDEAHAQAVRERGVNVVRDLSGGLRLPEGARTERVVEPMLPRIAPELDGRLNVQDLVLVFPELLKQGLERVVREAGAEHGLDSKARAKRLAEIDAELARIAAEHEELRAGASGVVSIEPLPEVHRRIAFEQSRAASQLTVTVKGAR